jgi:response regulator RpfG family c-di-GMP phosphodiesterase
MMKQHTLKGAQMFLKTSQSLYEEAAVRIALNHHESGTAADIRAM